MNEYVVEINDNPTITIDGWAVRCEDLFIQREPIVRCRDCAYYEEHGDEHWCTQHDITTLKDMADGFCAWGEKVER